MAKALGTTLFGHDIQPGSPPTLWVLNTDANNTGELGNNIANGTMTEPAIRGLVAQNRITRVDLTTGSIVGAPIQVDQPDTTGAGLLNPNRTIGQPYDVSFVPSGPREGSAFVVGLIFNFGRVRTR